MCFAHGMFLMLHFFALLFGLIGLFLTIPLHLIFWALCRKQDDYDDDDYYRRRRR